MKIYELIIGYGLVFFFVACSSKKSSFDFPIEVSSSHNIGHLVINGKSWPQNPDTTRVKTLIVGGGIAGLSAAYHLADSNYIICELADNFGGTSSSLSFNGQPFCQGAHYDVGYPDYYGSEVLKMLTELLIIEYDSTRHLWDFQDKQYFIKKDQESQSFKNGHLLEDILEPSIDADRFLDIITAFEDKMPLPTRLIKKEFHYLDTLSFKAFLLAKHPFQEEFLQCISYQLRDDYGAGAEEISALAGIHYYKCRPYYSTQLDYFSPPEGNAYFVDRIMKALPKENLISSRLVTNITPSNEKWITQTLDINNKTQEIIVADNIIYTGKKHALKYVCPEAAPKKPKTHYAPWVVVNFVVDGSLPGKGFWQNEFPLENSFLGFVDSRSQYGSSNKTILTAYFCFPENARKSLLNIDKNKSAYVDNALTHINAYFDTEISPQIDHAFIKVMGHAMPIAKPGYLFQDFNESRPFNNFVYAGVDNGRLPVLFEAVDSGIQAAELINTIH